MGARMTFSWRERHVLVTGATGIVGSWLCEELVRRGAYVVALVLDDDPQSRFYRAGIDRRCSIVRGHLARFDDCLRAINLHECTDVFHLGAQTIVGNALREPLETFESNIRGTYNLLEAARRLSPLVQTVVVASSDKAYGDSPVLPYTEDMPLQGKHPYDVSKSCTDLLATTYAHTYALPVTIARCGNIYGGGDLNWSRIVPGTIRSLANDERPVLRSDGGPIRDYIYVRDVVDAYLTLAEATQAGSVSPGEAFNFSPQSRYTVLEILAEIGRAMDVVPDPVILAQAPMEIRDQTLDAAKAKRQLGWEADWSLADGLAETVAWYREFFRLAAPNL
uniref:CDP-glucose 4,6-dehydratase n=1 Tax=uncultured organism TaxID=155900 RepID=A0A7L9QCC6_9ZZZZ|nr:CDP-glucose 4,6-dehydratase [uncultured organism]